MTIFALEFLTFGLNKLLDASEKNGEKLCLLTHNPSMYRYEINAIRNRNFSVIEVDTFDSDELYKIISNTSDAHGIVNTTDTWILTGIALANRLNFPAQSIDVVKTVRNKYKMRQCLYQHHCSAGKSWIVDPLIGLDDSVFDEINYPIIIKDNAGTGSQNVWIANNQHDLIGILSEAKTINLRGGHLTIEPYFSGTLYSAEVLVWEKEVKLLCFTSRIMSAEPAFMEEALSMPIQFSGSQTIEYKHWLFNILNAVEYTKGFAHIEFMVTHDGFEVIEINPRLGGVRIGNFLCDIYNINIYESFIDMALGRRPHLLDMELVPENGVAMALLYAKKVGNFMGIRGLDKIALHPGNPTYYPIVSQGQHIDHLNDQRAGVGILSATGDNSEIAMQNVLAAKNKLMIEID